MTNFWDDYLDNKATAWLGLDPTALTANYFLKVKSTGGGIEETSTLFVDISGFPPGSVLYADAEGRLQPHPTVDTNELSSLDGAEGNLDDRITALETAGGLDGLSVSVGGESDNTIVATIVGPAHNSLMEVWLSATDGGTYTTAFDGDSAAPWTLSDATAHITRTADVAYQILTGADADKADLAEIANENGYTAPIDIENAASESSGTLAVTAVDKTITASGGTVGPFRYVVCYNDDHISDGLICYWDYGSSITLQAGESFTIDFGASLFTLS